MAGRGTAPLPKGPELGGIRHLFSLGRPRLNGGPARDSRPIHRSARDETHVTLAEVLRLGAERFRQSLDACGVSVKETGHGKSSYGARDSLWRVIATIEARAWATTQGSRQWRIVSWRNGTNPPWRARFSAVRVTPAPEVWLLCERELREAVTAVAASPVGQVKREGQSDK